jgi:hypothetical protein
MLLVVRHTIWDPETFWYIAGQNIPELPPELKLHEMSGAPHASHDAWVGPGPVAVGR